MSLINSCLQLLIPILLIYTSLQAKDRTVAQITGMIGVAILLLSFLFSSLWMKLVLVLILYLVWLVMGEHLNRLLYHQLKK
ncbi:MAG: hypothetical protein QNJ32_07970 [Xenococcaceae cyanobacterium MO_167.B27]|nr:hypothetical protein [Xenococcaceae cyanobacterium MO_167.B27]